MEAKRKNSGSLIQDEKLKRIYRTMLQCRALEARARLLSGGGDFPTPGLRINEAAEVGCAGCLRAEDSVATETRGFILQFIHGIAVGTPASQLCVRLFGAQGMGGSSPRSGQPPHIIEIARESFDRGVSLARVKKRRKSGVAAAFSCGDSAEFWDDALALAGAESLPIVFVSGNGAAAPRGRAKGEDPSSKAQRFGFPGIPVDGNDVVAVDRVAHESIERARRGGGPTLIECKQYVCEDPLDFMEEYLSRKGLFRAEWKRQMIDEFARELDAACAQARTTAIDPFSHFR